jgi:hypothetical protein
MDNLRDDSEMQKLAVELLELFERSPVDLQPQ